MPAQSSSFFLDTEVVGELTSFLSEGSTFTFYAELRGDVFWNLGISHICIHLVRLRDVKVDIKLFFAVLPFSSRV